jgi:NAD(P)-dependent dehydrogenase (short-subunit alcohol dehydrogenase family)
MPTARHSIGGLKDAVAVVTGGASGIGLAVVDLLERCGAVVEVADLTTGNPVDVTDRAAVESLADAVRAAHGGLDVLVNAAGLLTPNLPAEQLPADDFRRAYEVNVLGTVNTCQALFPLLRERRGAIVNVASQAALVSLPQQAAYTAAKGAVAALTRSLAIDWAEHGIRANAVAPGFTLTPMTEGFFENATFTKAATGRIPLGRILDASEIAGAIVFLASPLASAVTGVTLPVDGGWTAGEPALPW